MQENKQIGFNSQSAQVKFKPLQLSNFSCIVKNPACSICISFDCQANGLMCRNQKCQCSTAHQKCSFAKLSQLIGKVNGDYKQIPQQIKKSYQIILKCYDDMIEMLSCKKAEIQDQMNNYGLRRKQIQFVQFAQSYEFNQLNGKFFAQLRNQIQQIHESQSAKPLKKSKKIAKIFQKGQKKLLNFLVYLDEQCIDFNKIKRDTDSQDEEKYEKMAFGSTARMLNNYQDQNEDQSQFEDYNEENDNSDSSDLSDDFDPLRGF